MSLVRVKDYPYHSQVPGVPPPPGDDELHTWVKIRVSCCSVVLFLRYSWARPNVVLKQLISAKVVQQLSGQKRSFSTMTRDGEGSTEWGLPPQPSVVLPPASAPVHAT